MEILLVKKYLKKLYKIGKFLDRKYQILYEKYF